MPTSSKILWFSASLIGLGWLMPNHYLPWLTAWGDAITIMVLLSLAATLLWQNAASISLPRPLFWVAIICITMLLVQWQIGRIFFSGDALLAGAYVVLWLTAVAVGGLLVRSPLASGVLNALAFGWVMAAALSVGIAIVQATGTLNLGIYGAELPFGLRPFGNVAQPNHLSTLCFIGLCSLLWLFEQRVVQRLAFWLGGGFLLFGIAMSQSRTGWLQVGLMVVAGLLARQLYKSRLAVPQLLGLGGVFIAWVLLWPRLCEVLLLKAGISLADQIAPGKRPQHWRAMWDAIQQEPWWGYGWQQVGAAQQRVALNHPPVGEYIEHSHNFLLDLLLWNGIPVGLIITALLLWWLLSRLRAIKDAGSVWWLVLAGGIVIHGMLEFAIEYAYFLIPLGLAMGLLERLAPSKALVFIAHKRAVFSLTLLAVFFAWTASEYLSVEQAQRTLRLESARIGVDRISTPIEPRRLLNQLEAYQRFASLEAMPNMSPEQLERMRIVSLRFGYPPVLFRYALAAGLNAQPSAARRALDLICRIHPPENCSQAGSAWQALQLRFPQLSVIEAPTAAFAEPAN